MSFITKEDYGISIRENLLDAITEVDDDKIDKASAYAIKRAKGYLSARYDVAAIFAAEDDDRDEVILQHCINIALCQLHSLVNPRKIPLYRLDDKKEAIEWFKEVQACKINPPDLPVLTGDDEGKKNYILYGSNTKRNNHLSS